MRPEVVLALTAYRSGDETVHLDGDVARMIAAQLYRRLAALAETGLSRVRRELSD